MRHGLSSHSPATLSSALCLRQELVKRYSDLLTEELKERSNDEQQGARGAHGETGGREGMDNTTAAEGGLILSNSFQRRPIPMSAFLQQHRLQQLEGGGGNGATAVPGLASDPRSLINYRNLMQSSTRGVLRQMDANETDDEDSSSARSTFSPWSTMSHPDHDGGSGSGSSGGGGGYRVMTNPSIRFYSTSSNGRQPRIIQLRSSSQDSHSNSQPTNTVRIITYPRSGSHRERSDTMEPVTYILRRVPGNSDSNGSSGYIPVAFRHRSLAVGHDDEDEEDSDDGL
jgi:hypothetical protein